LVVYGAAFDEIDVGGGFMLIPDHETAVDFLNYEAVAKTVVALLKDNRQYALTIGIHGDWGAGKSSVLRMVEAGMRPDDKVACLWFNGWTFQGFDDAKTVLIEVIVSELIRQRSTYGKVKEKGLKLLKRINVMKLARHGVGLGVFLKTGIPPHITAAALGRLHDLAANVGSMSPDDIKGKIDEAAGFLKPAEAESIPEEIHHFREEFAKLLEEAKIDQLVVLIDDLDRCLPSRARRAGVPHLRDAAARPVDRRRRPHRIQRPPRPRPQGAQSAVARVRHQT
jgi:predicted KAP-like P-loop ATPase